MNASCLFRRAFLWAAISLLGAGANAADEALSPTPEPLPPSMQAFGAANADCLEWTNACLICRRLDGAADAEENKEAQKNTDPEENDIACSTPGIACQPAGISCTALR